LTANRRFRWTFRLHLQSRKKARKYCEAGSKQNLLVYSSTMKMATIVPLKRRPSFNGLQAVISQKRELFIMTSVYISNPTRGKDLRLCRQLWMEHTARGKIFRFRLLTLYCNLVMFHL
jgi:hypothetical protein